MNYEIEWEQDASNALGRLDAKAVERILLRVDWLSANLDYVKPQVLAGTLRGYFKLRTGDYRIIYAVNRAKRLIIIHDVGHRRDIYKEK